MLWSVNHIALNLEKQLPGILSWKCYHLLLVPGLSPQGSATCAAAGAAGLLSSLCHLELVSNQSWKEMLRDEAGAAQWKLH